MQILKIIAYILLTLYFLYRLGTGVYILFIKKIPIEEIQKEVRSVQGMWVYWLGLVENAIMIVLVQLIYWL